MDRIEQQLGNYRLTRILGHGSFADVYLGEQIYLGSQAAIKILHAQLLNDERESFLSEARTLVSLAHPHIVRVLDFGVEDTLPFLVMDYAPNGTLRQYHLRGEQLPLPIVVSYTRQIAEALFYAHQQKLIHRDVKPENMLIGKNNDVLLGDFGIAIIAQSSRYQGPKEIAGTIAYMAPEQIQAHPCPASDQYALGMVVYEWLSGNTPFHGSFTEIAAKHVCVSPPSLREKNPSISPAVEQVVMKALEKDPVQRFADIKTFALALEQANQETLLSPFKSSPTLPDEVFQPTIISARQPSLTRTSSSSLDQTRIADLSLPPLPRYYQQDKPTHSRHSILVILLSLFVGALLAVSIVFSPLMTALHGGSITTSATQLPASNSSGVSVVPTHTSVRSIPATPSSIATVSSSKPVIALPPVTSPPASPVPTIPSAAPVPSSSNPYTDSGKLVLDDPLSDNSQGYDWLTGVNQRGATCEFSNGGYYSTQPVAGFFHSCVARNTDFSNFAFEVQVTLISGDYAGIIFCNATNDTYYLFRVQTDGMYKLLRFDGSDSEGTTLLTGSISIDLSQPNLIAVVVDQGTIELYTNRQLINSVSDTTYTHGRIAVLAGNNGTSAQVMFSNAKVWAL